MAKAHRLHNSFSSPYLIRNTMSEMEVTDGFIVDREAEGDEGIYTAGYDAI